MTNKVVVKLAKTKGEYSFDTWQTLQSKKTREEKRAKAAKASTKENPMGGIMDMMKDMYDSGDDKMKKVRAAHTHTHPDLYPGPHSTLHTPHSTRHS